MGRRPLSGEERRSRKAFGEKIKNVRLEKSLTLKVAAKGIDIETSRLARIEGGARPVNQAVLTGMESFYGIPLEALLMASPARQLPLAVATALRERPQASGRRDERFIRRVTLEEKRELANYLRYLRHKARRRKSNLLSRSAANE